MSTSSYSTLTLFPLESRRCVSVGLAQVTAELTLKALVTVVSRVCWPSDLDDTHSVHHVMILSSIAQCQAVSMVWVHVAHVRGLTNNSVKTSDRLTGLTAHCRRSLCRVTPGTWDRGVRRGGIKIIRHRQSIVRITIIIHSKYTGRWLKQ